MKVWACKCLHPLVNTRNPATEGDHKPVPVGRAASRRPETRFPDWIGQNPGWRQLPPALLAYKVSVETVPLFAQNKEKKEGEGMLNDNGSEGKAGVWRWE